MGTENFVNKIICGDSRDLIKELDDDSIDMIMTSPPYFALRDYEIDKQIGMEDHPQKYIDEIINIFSILKNKLKKSGCVYLNLGDSYYSKSGSGQGSNFLYYHNILDGGRGLVKKAHTEIRGKYNDGKWLQSKQLLLIPSRVAIAMQDIGFILRNDCVWFKNNSMPSSVQDRWNTCYEHVFFFVKSNKYYFNMNEIRKPLKANEKIMKILFEVYEKQKLEKRETYNGKFKDNNHANNQRSLQESILRTRKVISRIINERDLDKEEVAFLRNYAHNSFTNPRGTIPKDVWQLSTAYSELGHYASYSEELCINPIKASCPENGTTLDPFCGSGTTCVVAKKLKRNFIGFDINPEYVDISIKRLNGYEAKDFKAERENIALTKF